jgi:hypothetical protein
VTANFEVQCSNRAYTTATEQEDLGFVRVYHFGDDDDDDDDDD